MPSKPNLIILGPSGSGKTSSLEGLFKKHGPTIAFIDHERKGLPFLYDVSQLAQFSEVETWEQAQVAFTKAKQDSKVHLIVYDSFTNYLEQLHAKVKTCNTGWDIWNAYNDGVRAFFEFNKSTGKLWIMTAIDEVVYVEQAEGSRVSRVRVAIQGKKWEGKVEPQFLCVLYCTTVKGKDGMMKHVFRSGTDGITSAKTPQWLGLANEIPNDVCPIVDKLIEAKLV